MVVYSSIFQSSVRFRFVELFLLDSTFTKKGGPEFFLLASPKLPPNCLITASDKIKPANADSSEQIVFHGVSIEMTFPLHDLL